MDAKEIHEIALGLQKRADRLLEIVRAEEARTNVAETQALLSRFVPRTEESPATKAGACFRAVSKHLKGK
jgi:hypothetical protein